MNTAHLSDEEIQLFVANLSAASSSATDHLAVCTHCSEQVALYRSLFKAIAEQEIPVFDVDMSALVLAQLPVYKEKKSLWVPVIFIICCFAGAVLYIFRQNFLMILSGSSLVFLLAGLAGFIAVVAIRINALYKKFRYNCNLIY